MAVPFGMANGIAQPTMNGLFFKLCAPGRNPETSAVFSAMGNLSGISTSIMAGVLSGITGYTKLYYGATFFPIISLLLFLCHMTYSKKVFARRAAAKAAREQARAAALQAEAENEVMTGNE
jgi:hypothetical protein